MQAAQHAAQFKAILRAVESPQDVSEFDLGTPAYQSSSGETTEKTLSESLSNVSSLSFIKNGKEIATIKPTEIEYFTKKSFGDLIESNKKLSDPILIAFVSLRQIFPSHPNTPSIEENEEGIEPELTQFMPRFLRKNFSAISLKKHEKEPQYLGEEYSIQEKTIKEAHKARGKERKKYLQTYQSLKKFYEADLFNAWRYDGFPLTEKKIANPESRDPEEARYNIRSVEYYMFDPQRNNFTYKFSDVSLVGSDNQFFIAWLNAHQNLDPFTRALASAELGNIYTQKGLSGDAKKYFQYALVQKDSIHAQALANYYVGKALYDQYLDAPGNGKQKLIEKALSYFINAYEAQQGTFSKPVHNIALQSAYYLGVIYDEVPAYKDEKKAKEYFDEAMEKKELRPLILERLSEPKTIGTCCGFGIFKKRNKIAPQHTSINRKSAF